MQNLTQGHSSQTKHLQKRNNIPVSQVFATMKANYAHKFTSTFKSKPEVEVAMQVWEQQLAPLTNQQIENGLNRCVKLADWNPCISEFLRAAFDLPTKDQCVSRINSEQTLDRVSYLVLHRCGGRAHMDTMTEVNRLRAIERAYPDAYEHTLNDYISGNIENDLVSIEDALKNMTPQQKSEYKFFQERQAELIRDGYPVKFDPTMDFEEIKDVLGNAEHKRHMDQLRAGAA